MNYELTVKFRTSGRKQFYAGESFLRKNLSDTLEITENEIKILFTRTSKVEASVFLSTTNSLLRFQVQRALSYYLAVAGEFPPVDSIFLSDGNQKHHIEHKGFTETWKNCELTYQLNPEHLNPIFQSQPTSKALYIALTYWLKAQLANFSGDRFRAAWSGFNALYTSLSNSPSDSETSKIKCFFEKMANAPFHHSIQYLETTCSQDFWSRLDWYNYLKGTRTNKETLLQNYCDKLINPYLISALKRTVLTDEFIYLSGKYNRKISNAVSSSYVQLKFLVIEYCYLLRNRSFHGGKAYPLLVIAPEAETRVDDILCNLLLLLVQDTIEHMNH